MMDARAALTTIATGQARLQRARLDLPRRQERAEPRGRARPRAPGRRGAGRRRGGDADARQVQRPDRAGRAARGQEHAAGAQAVRPGEPRPRDPRPLQHGGRVPPRADVPGGVPGPAERQPRLLGRAGRRHRLARGRRRRPPPDRPRARRLPRRRRQQAVRRAGLLPRDRARRARGKGARDLWRARAQRRRHRHALHPARQRGNGPAIRDGVDRASRPASREFPYLAAPNPDPPQPPQHVYREGRWNA